MSLVVKNCLPMQVNLREVGLIPGLGRTPPPAPEEGTVTHSSILACRIPRTEEPGRLQSMESQEERLKQLSTHAPYLVCEVAWEVLSNDW